MTRGRSAPMRAKARPGLVRAGSSPVPTDRSLQWSPRTRMRRRSWMRCPIRGTVHGRRTRKAVSAERPAASGDVQLGSATHQPVLLRCIKSKQVAIKPRLEQRSHSRRIDYRTSKKLLGLFWFLGNAAGYTLGRLGDERSGRESPWSVSIPHPDDRSRCH